MGKYSTPWRSGLWVATTIGHHATAMGHCLWQTKPRPRPHNLSSSPVASRLAFGRPAVRGVSLPRGLTAPTMFHRVPLSGEAVGHGGPVFWGGGSEGRMGQGGTLFHKGVTTRDPRVPPGPQEPSVPLPRGTRVPPGTGGGTPGDRRRHGKVKVFSWVRKSMKGWVIFAFNLFKIIWGVNPDKILDIFLIVPRVNYQYQETGISQKFTGVKL